jgi:V8-like Glu-specific endopeptidase
VGRGQPGQARSPARIAVGGLALAAALALALALTDRVGAADPGGGFALEARSTAEAGAAARYWTPERMENAEPADLTVSGSGSPAARGSGIELLNHPIGFTRTHITNTTAYPARVHGRSFFTIGMGNFACSGTVIAARGRNAILTAGHCVYDSTGGTGFVSNWMFVPGYNDPDGPGGNPPSQPFGTFPAVTLLAPAEWTDSGAVNSDFAGVIVGPNAGGQQVENSVGSRGIAFGQRRNQAYRAFGYPLAAPFDGSKLFRCDSRYGGDGPGQGSGGPPMAIGCDFTGGSSGGGWVARNTFVESVVSFRLGSHPDVIYGPHLEGAASRLYRRGLGGWSCRGLAATMVGTAAGERITGTPRRDVIFAHGGRDRIRAGGGNDVVCGGPGPDVINGGKGRRDKCSGGAGDDNLTRGCERRS